MKDLSIIILNFNTKDYTLKCLKSLENHDSIFREGTSEIIVVDNDSTDGSIEAIEKKFPRVKLIKNKNNLGFAKANNKGIKKAKGEIILLLNSDTIVHDETLTKMIEFIKENENLGAATPRLELTDGSLDLACHRGFPTPWNAVTYFSGLEQFFPNLKIFSGYHQTWKDFNTPHQVGAISGACFFIKREVIDEIGLLDERFFMYAEDLDWCMRIKQAGWKIFYNPDAKVTHFKKRSGREKEKDQEESKTRKVRAQTIEHFYDTMKLFYDKHYQEKYPKWLRSKVLFGIWLLTKFKLARNRKI